ncbi:hypothetical protein [Ectothiorhodospira lacustris]|uniref:hypothetical protein n=1 Tax=Ectothiorhodospira TaxID=1051 RepID=UPI001EE7BDE9|nr:hypothetical protein [Ectothiorhodospira lacustris]MCG5501907.1 hypothetical protein [Ectothiorhodospira lacustris]
MQPIIQSDRDRHQLNWLIQEKGVTKAAIENAADRIAARGQRPYPSNILKFFGYRIEEAGDPPA